MSNKEDSRGVVVPMPREFVKANRTEGLDPLADGSEFEGIHCSALVMCAVGQTAFGIYWNTVRDRAEYGHGVF